MSARRSSTTSWLLVWTWGRLSPATTDSSKRSLSATSGPPVQAGIAAAHKSSIVEPALSPLWPRKGSGPEPVPEPEPEPVVGVERPPEYELSELERQVMWRTTHLLDLGFSMHQIEQLPLLRPDIAHEADRLLTRGCPHSYVVTELRED